MSAYTAEAFAAGKTAACQGPAKLYATDEITAVKPGDTEAAIRADWTVEKYGQFCQRRFIELRRRGVAPSVAFSVYHHACNQYERMAAQMACYGLPAHRFDECGCGVVKHRGDKVCEMCAGSEAN